MARKKASLGCLFWLALVLLVIVIFLFNQKNIEHVLRRTGFWNLFSSDDKPIDVTIEKDSGSDDPSELKDAPANPPTEIVLKVDEEVPEKQSPDQDDPRGETDKAQSEEQNAEKESNKSLRKARIYFVVITPEGGIALKSVIRPVYFDNSPLRETLKALLDGPTAAEINQGYLSVIPERTDLRNVYVKGQTAFLDFSDDFRFNSIGQAGLKAQLRQIVFTATEFSNVSDVQILIEGKRQKYLSQEGLSIADPVSRSSLN
jgi:spore germination protein GerM